MNASDNIVALARELGVGRRLLYVWRINSTRPILHLSDPAS
jgi:transposase-like protein